MNNQKFECLKTILSSLDHIQIIDGRTRNQILEILRIEDKKLHRKSSINVGSTIKYQIRQNTEFLKSNNFSNSPNLQSQDHNIEIIKIQWDKEIERVKKIEQQKTYDKKLIIQNTCVTEASGNYKNLNSSALYLFGAAFQKIEKFNDFEFLVKIHFEFVLIDFIIQTNYVENLKQLKSLQELTLHNNNACTLLQLARLEQLNMIALEIKNNPINSCTFLKEFVIYRFPNITVWNGKEIKEIEKLKAQVDFEYFDKTLQIPERINNSESTRKYVQSSDWKMVIKCAQIVSENQVGSYFSKGVDAIDKDEITKGLFEDYVHQLIQSL